MPILKHLPRLRVLLIILFFLIASSIRIINLGKIPIGLTNDEADIGYDAYSILKTGKDQWGHAQPGIALEGFGDYRPPIYTYAVIPSIALFDLNEFAVRLPAAIAGSLTVLLVYFLTMQLWRKQSLGIIAMSFLAFNPWHIGMSRVGIESTFGAFLITAAITVFLMARTRRKLLFLSLSLFALSVYTYTSYILLAPILVILLFYIYRKTFFTKEKMGYLSLLLFFLLLLPIIIGGGMTARARTGQVNFTKDIGIINIVNDKRGECQTDFNPRLCQVFENKFVAYISTFTFNYLNHFSPDLLMRSGTPTQYSILPQRGLLLTTEYLFFILGILFLLKRREKEDIFLLFWILLAPLADSLTGPGHYSRFLPILPAIQLTAALGFYNFYIIVSKRRWVIIPILTIATFEIVTFFLVYTTYFPRFYAISSHYGYKQLMNYLVANEDKYSKIVVSSSVNDTKQYIYYLFYTNYDPAAFQQGKNVEKIKEDGGWTRVSRIGKVFFLPSISLARSDFQTPTPHILVAGAKSEFPKTVKAKHAITDPKNNVIFLLVDTANNSWLIPKK